MVDSPHHPEQEVIFALSEAGVVDPEDGTTKKTTVKKPTAQVGHDSSITKPKIKKVEPETMDSEKKTATKTADAEKTETDATKSE